jgi:hypothetical protein
MFRVASPKTLAFSDVYFRFSTYLSATSSILSLTGVFCQEQEPRPLSREVPLTREFYCGLLGEILYWDVYKTDSHAVADMWAGVSLYLVIMFHI